MAGSSGSNEIRAFDAKEKGYPCVDIYRENLDSSVYCVDFANNDSEVFFGTAGGEFLNFTTN